MKSEDSDAVEDVIEEEGGEDAVDDTVYENLTEGGTGYEVTGFDDGEETTKSMIKEELRD